MWLLQQSRFLGLTISSREPETSLQFGLGMVSCCFQRIRPEYIA